MPGFKDCYSTLITALYIWVCGLEEKVIFCCGSHTCSWDEQNMNQEGGRFETERANASHWKQCEWKSGVFPTVPLVMVTGGARQEKSQLLQSQQKNLAQTTAGSSSLSWRKIQFEDKFLQRLTDQSARLHGLKVHFQVYRSSLWSVADTFCGNQCQATKGAQKPRTNPLFASWWQNRHKKLLISPLPTFHFYHQDCNFCSFELGQKGPE